ncbi:small fragment nuclease isoform X2 [Micropterus salmoides]|uniref:small fragment nuclease isoform X2 n=1 Tax=Micropterus salmoides TaxID=27706 RepID=UPI0018EC2659|nr:small fragment nuclease isoform X2 [Micropterus salmoides]
MTSAWIRVTLDFLCKRSQFVIWSGKEAFHSHCSSVLQKNVSRKTSMSSNTMSQRMVWVDLEMTGLDIEKDQIIEMACIITDSDLNILAEGPNLIINQPDQLLEGMSLWCKEHHGKSGLTQAVRDSKITLEQAEYEFLSFVRQHTPPGQCPLADGGFQRNTVWCLTREQPTEPWMTFGRALKSCNTTEPISSKSQQRRRSAKL